MNVDTALASDLAERAVVSEVIYNPAAVREASAHVMGRDFADTRLGRLFDLVVGMVTAGGATTVTSSTVLAETLKRRSEAIRDKSGRNPWLALPDHVEFADLIGGGTASVAADANVIREAAEGRALAKFGRRVTHAAESDADKAQLAALVVEEAKRIRDGWRTTGLGFRTLADVLADEALGEYDWLIPGLLERGDRLVLTGGEGGGKALALDTPIPTPKGWTTMGALTVGQEVFAADGTPTVVTAATDVMLDRPCYRVTFSDGSSIVADEDHQWLTSSLAAREADADARRRPEGVRPRGTDQRWKRKHWPAVVTTGQIRDTLHARNGHALNHSVAVCAPLQYPSQELLVAPYTLGAWLGDGHSAGARITLHPDDVEILDRIREDGWDVRPQASSPYTWSLGDGNGKGKRGDATLQGRLRVLGVLRNKHIPAAYLMASVEQRLDLLRGLMDTDGTIHDEGTGAAFCEFSVCSERLAKDAQELLLGLGIKVTLRSGPARIDGRTVGTRYRLSFQTDLPVFHLRRKAKRLAPLRTQRAKLRYITAVEPVESVPVRCIQVAHDSHLFLAGRECIPTHNSTFLRQLALCAAAGVQPFTADTFKPCKVMVIDAENSYRQWHRKARGVVLAVERLTGANPAEHINLACTGRQDITKARDLGNIHAALDDYEPDLLMIGPLYKLLPGAINNDTDAAPLITALDGIRERGITLLMEAHAGKGESGSGERHWAPRGSSALMGWPEFGLGLAPDADNASIAHVRRWRGDRDERNWPRRMRRGGVLPWTNDADDPPPSDQPQWTPSYVLGRTA